MALLRQETRVRRGQVPHQIDGVVVEPNNWKLSEDAILLRADGNVRVLYRRGEGVTVDAPDGTDPRDIDLWLNGTIYSAVAAFNGLMPLHASAVAHEGRVYAFTGPPGAGKSTLAAALGQHGFPLFCDDTLILDLSGSGPITCLPGHKRLKLWPEGMVLARATPREEVASHYPKRFAEPAGGLERKPLPLAELVFLESGPVEAIIPIDFGERIARLQDDHYTAFLFEHSNALPPRERFAQLAEIAGRMPMRRFIRRVMEEHFAEGLACMVRHISEGGAE